MRLCSLMLLGLLLVACGSMQFRINNDGSMERVSPEDVTEERGQQLATHIDKMLGPGWRSSVAINPDPYYASDEKDFNSWWWDRALVQILITGGPDQQTDTVNRAAVERRIQSRMRDWMTQMNALDIQSTVVISNVPLEQAVEQQRYVVQKGDTLAMISTAFYGTPDHWRRLAEANGLDMEQPLTAGTSLIIPHWEAAETQPASP